MFTLTDEPPRQNVFLKLLRTVLRIAAYMKASTCAYIDMFIYSNEICAGKSM